MRTVLLLLLPLALVSTAFAAEPPVLRVLVVEAADVETYLSALERGRAIMARLGVEPRVRTWAEEEGTEAARRIVLTVEYADAETRDRWSRVLDSSEEYRRWAERLDDVRHIVSDDEYVERLEP